MIDAVRAVNSIQSTSFPRYHDSGCCHLDSCEVNMT